MTNTVHTTAGSSEASGPAMPPLARAAHLLEPLFARATHDPDAVLAARREGDRFRDVTVKEAVDTIRGLAKGFAASGVAPGDRVALMSHTRLEWMLLDHAILAAGAVTVPIYDTSSAEQIRWIISDSEAVMAVVETSAMADVVEPLRADLPTCREVLIIEADALERARVPWVGDRRHDDRSADRRTRHRHDRHDHLHLRHDRTSEGMRADPRQPARQRRPGARRDRPRGPPRRHRIAVPSPRPRADQGQCAVRRRGGRHDRLRHRCRTPGRGAPVVPAHDHGCGPADLREGVQHRQPHGPPRAQGTDLRPCRRRGDPLVP